MTTCADEFQSLGNVGFYWSVYEPTLKCDMGCTALKTDSGLVVIDPVPLAEEAWKEILKNRPLRAILLTNGNHVRHADVLRKLHKVPIVTAPATNRDIIEIKCDVVLLETELLYGISPVYLPGATVGETAFFSQAGVMALGDAIINTDPQKGMEFLPDKYCHDPEQNRLSLKKLLQFDFHTLTFAHGLPVASNAKEKLNALLH